jgi:hypothetical protein
MEFPEPQAEDNTNTDLPSPSSSSSSSVDSASGRLILDAIRGPKQQRKVKPGLIMPIPISVPVEVEGDLGSLSDNSSVKPKTTKVNYLNKYRMCTCIRFSASVPRTDNGLPTTNKQVLDTHARLFMFEVPVLILFLLHRYVSNYDNCKWLVELTVCQCQYMAQ